MGIMKQSARASKHCVEVVMHIVMYRIYSTKVFIAPEKLSAQCSSCHELTPLGNISRLRCGCRLPDRSIIGAQKIYDDDMRLK